VLIEKYVASPRHIEILNDLLVAPLKRAVALKEVHAVPVRIGKDPFLGRAPMTNAATAAPFDRFDAATNIDT
jgi:hypothetical protein